MNWKTPLFRSCCLISKLLALLRRNTIEQDITTMTANYYISFNCYDSNNIRIKKSKFMWMMILMKIMIELKFANIHFGCLWIEDDVWVGHKGVMTSMLSRRSGRRPPKTGTNRRDLGMTFAQRWHITGLEKKGILMLNGVWQLY